MSRPPKTLTDLGLPTSAMVGWSIELSPLHLEIWQEMEDDVSLAFTRAWFRVYSVNSYEEMRNVAFTFQASKDDMTAVLNVPEPDAVKIDMLICGVFSALEIQYEARMKSGDNQA